MKGFAEGVAGLLALLVAVVCFMGTLLVAWLAVWELAETVGLTAQEGDLEWPGVLAGVAVLALLWPLFFALTYYGLRDDFERYTVVRWVRILRFLRHHRQRFFDDNGYPFAHDLCGKHYLGARSARTVRPAEPPDYRAGADVCLSFKLTGHRYDVSDWGGEWVWTDRRGTPIENPCPDEPIARFVPEGARRWEQDRRLSAAEATVDA